MKKAKKQQKWDENKNTSQKKKNKKQIKENANDITKKTKKNSTKKQEKDTKNPNRFYVYIYLDPRKPGNYVYGEYKFDYEPFYVGRGQTHRINQHLTESKERNTHKINKIQKILKENLEPIRIKLIENLTNKIADEIEIKLIALIGREDLEKGPLTNKTNGGLTNTGRIISKKTREKMSLAQKGRKAPKERVEKQAKTMLGNKQMKSGRATSKFVGVHYSKRNKKWMANIGFNKKTIYIGMFNEEIQAGVAYNRKAIELYGTNAKLNNIENWEIYIIPPSTKSSKYKGVRFKNNKWVAYTTDKHIGIFNNEDEAAMAYNKTIFNILGKNAKLNNIENWEKYILPVKPKKTSKYKGVYLRNSNGKWVSIITKNKEIIRLGEFKNELDAAIAYNKKAFELYGDKAKLNDILNWKSISLPIKKEKKSKYIGVTEYNRKTSKYKWQAHISKNKKRIYIGLFEMELDAAKAYNDFIIKNNLHRKLNII